MLDQKTLKQSLQKSVLFRDIGASEVNQIIAAGQWRIVKQYSGWIMTFLCILLFWIETAWNAYESPRVTAWIILSITLSSLFFSMFFKRRVWCHYLCPLGVINALFSMPSILELRANRHMCTNRCFDHLCSNGATFILQLITIIGSLIASLYATQRIIKRLLVDRQYSQKMYLASALLLCLSAIAYLFLV